MKVRKKLFFILMIMWMAGIFMFSSRSGNESAQDSYFAGNMIGELFVPGFRNWSEEKQAAFAAQIDYPVRKTAHASEYAVLAIFAAGVYLPDMQSESRRFGSKKGYAEKIRKKKEWILSWGIASLYAASDEIHQLFVPGRSGQVTDVILDSAGAAAGLVLAAIIITVSKKIRSSCSESRN